MVYKAFLLHFEMSCDKKLVFLQNAYFTRYAILRNIDYLYHGTSQMLILIAFIDTITSPLDISFIFQVFALK